MKTEEDPLIQSWERLWMRAGEGLRSPMRYLAYFFIVILLLVGALYLWGFLLPEVTKSERSLTCTQSSQEFLRFIQNVSAYPEWQSDVIRVDLIKKINNEILYKAYYTQTRFLYYKARFFSNRAVFEVSPSAFASESDTSTASEKGGFRAVLELWFEPYEQGTRITVKESTTYLGPIQRALASFFQGRRLYRYIEDLNQACN